MTRYYTMASGGIFDPNLLSIKRNTSRRSSPAMIVMQVGIPSKIQERYINIILSTDIIFVKNKCW